MYIYIEQLDFLTDFNDIVLGVSIFSSIPTTNWGVAGRGEGFQILEIQQVQRVLPMESKGYFNISYCWWKKSQTTTWDV